MLNYSTLLAGETAIQQLSARQSLESATTTPSAQAQLNSNSWTQLDSRKLKLRSASALIIDSEGNELYSKQSEEARPIGSITKLMTVMVILDSKLALDE